MTKHYIVTHLPTSAQHTRAPSQSSGRTGRGVLPWVSEPFWRREGTSDYFDYNISARLDYGKLKQRSIEHV